MEKDLKESCFKSPAHYEAYKLMTEEYKKEIQPYHYRIKASANLWKETKESELKPLEDQELKEKALAKVDEVYRSMIQYAD